MTKICQKCGEEKPVEAFPKNIRMRNGRLNACKPCEYARVRTWRIANPQRVSRNNKNANARILVLPEGITQLCNKCLMEKALSAFHSAPAMKLGVKKTCKECILTDIAQRHRANPEIRRIRSIEWRANNPLRSRQVWRSYAERNKEKRLRERKEYRLKNIDNERERERQYLINNRPIVRAKNARRRAAETQATPSWLNAIQKAQIVEFYELASACEMQTGEPYHVDHIVPLRGNDINGLHVPWNLQVLTEFDNCSKHNKVFAAEARI